MTEPKPAYVQPVLLSDSLATRALSDPSFFVQLPEYSSLRAKMQTMHADLSSTHSGGCGSCRKRRVVRTLFSDFMTVTNSLSPDGFTRLKGYFGAPALILNHVNQANGQMQIKTI